jgi:DNA-binding MarR family transcriptional regulator
MASVVSEFYKATKMQVELQLLATLARCPNDSQSRIAHRAGIGYSAAHLHLHRLKAAGLIEFRGPSDKKLLYMLTKAGRGHYEMLSAKHFDVMMRFAVAATRFISHALERAHAAGVQHVAAIASQGAMDLVVSASNELGMRAERLRLEDLERQSGEAEGQLPEAILVVEDRYSPEVTETVARAEALGVPCYFAGEPELQEEEPTGDEESGTGGSADGDNLMVRGAAAGIV